jgi:hypothetical protein
LIAATIDVLQTNAEVAVAVEEEVEVVEENDVEVVV